MGFLTSRNHQVVSHDGADHRKQCTTNHVTLPEAEETWGPTHKSSIPTTYIIDFYPHNLIYQAPPPNTLNLLSHINHQFIHVNDDEMVFLFSFEVCFSVGELNGNTASKQLWGALFHCSNLFVENKLLQEALVLHLLYFQPSCSWGRIQLLNLLPGFCALR